MRPPDMDPCEVLGVSCVASPEEIQAAWKAGVRRYHPDTAPSGLAADYTERTQRLNVARDLLLTRGHRPCPPPPTPSSPPCPPPPPVVPATPSASRAWVAPSPGELLGRIVLAAVWGWRLLLAYVAVQLVLGIAWLLMEVAT